MDTPLTDSKLIKDAIAAWIEPKVIKAIAEKSTAGMAISLGMAHMLDLLCAPDSEAETIIRAFKRSIDTEIDKLLKETN